MTQTTNINIRMDSKLKKEFEQFCQDVRQAIDNKSTVRYFFNFILKPQKSTQKKSVRHFSPH